VRAPVASATRRRAAGPTRPEPTPLDLATALLADTWTLLILQRALLGERRYGRWKRTLGISDASLSSRLRALTDAGLLETRPYREGGRARHEYRLTASGRDTWAILTAIWLWERAWVSRELPLPDPVHTSCGAVTDLLVSCAHCDLPTELVDLDLDPGARVPIVGPPGARLHPRRTRAPLPADPLSAFPGAMEIIGDRWGAAVLSAALVGVRTFSGFERGLGVSPDVLADRLRRFRALGVLDQGQDGYRPTERGRATFPILACLADWGRRWMAAEGRPAAYEGVHRACGRPFRPRLRCRECREELVLGTVLPADLVRNRVDRG
jgi:DNA-binding HxlR family transcriptional regulator